MALELREQDACDIINRHTETEKYDRTGRTEAEVVSKRREQCVKIHFLYLLCLRFSDDRKDERDESSENLLDEGSLLLRYLVSRQCSVSRSLGLCRSIG